MKYISRMFRFALQLLAGILFVLTATQLVSGQTQTFTTDKVIELLQLKVAPDAIISAINQNLCSFDLSTEALTKLDSAGGTIVLETAMFQANQRSKVALKTIQPAQSTVPAGEKNAPGAPQPAPVPPMPAVKAPDAPNTPDVAHAPPAPPALPPPTTPPSNSYPPHTPERFQEAIGVSTNPASPYYPKQSAPPADCSKNNTVSQAKAIRVDLDWNPAGGSNTLQLDKSGNYCFAVHNVDDFIYTYSPTFKFQELTGDPISMMKDAITSVQSLGGAQTPKPQPGLPISPVVNTCSLSFDDVNKTAGVLNQALAVMTPHKDSTGTVVNGSLSDSQTAWSAVPAAFHAFETSVAKVIAQMGTTPDASCGVDNLGHAEFIVLDTYANTIRPQYLSLGAIANGTHTLYFPRPIKSYGDNTLTITQPATATTTAVTNTYQFPHAYAILNSSVGFLLTELPARSYTSRTAPNPATPTTATQNVLGVDYGAGIRPAFVVLLNANPSSLNSRNFGIGVSAGPVFDILNGKADTSKFGFFAGLSVRFTPHLYITPGVHVGQFADFPQGFVSPGQVIPPNTGTPTPNMRYSARFAFAITWKSKDLGATVAPQPSTNSPAPADQTKKNGNP